MKQIIKYLVSIFTISFLLTFNHLAAQTTLTYSESFTQGVVYASSDAQWINWSSFIAQLSPRTYASVTIKGSNDANGVSVSDATVATAIANALFTGVHGQWTTGGRIWNVGSCGSGLELSAGTTNECLCQAAYTVRPQIGNSSWGGINGPSCNPGSQTMTVIFVAGDVVTQTYNYTGSVQSCTIPTGVTSVSVESWGAQGANTSFSGGLGGYSKGELAVTPGEVLNIYVGGQGTVYSVGDQGSWTGGGWNGGGLGYRSGRGGGGASDIRRGGTALTNRVIVAAGGGGAANTSQCYGGSGGAAVGSAGLRFNANDPGFCGQGGTQGAGGSACINYGSAAGGILGQGGNGGTSGNSDGSGGGGGFYGGGGGDQGGAGGGSSYTGGVSSASTSPGLRSGNGQINITYQSYTNDQTLIYTGSTQTWVVPEGVTTVTLETWGAQGWTGSYSGGLGGYAKGDLSVTPGQVLNIFVGGQGTAAVGNAAPGGGGWNGGGNGQTNASANSAGGGGGASDVRSGGTALANRVIVGAGGGGSTNNTGCTGGNGGGVTGSDGGGAFSPGTGGTQSSGGSTDGVLGQGGNAISGMTPWNGGGGGGYYGGGVSVAHGPGGGGSSYIQGLTNTSTTSGIRSGNGLVVITYTLTTTTTPNSPSITFGTTSVDLTATVAPNPGGGSVEFFVDGNTAGSASVNAGTGIATLAFSTSALGVGSFVIRADFGGFNGNPASSSNPSSNGTLTISNPGFNWEGDVSANWNTAGNWSTNMVPTAVNNVNIPSGMPRWPHITSNSAFPSECYSLNIADGAMITIDAGKALSVIGTMTNNTGTGGFIIESGGSFLNKSPGVSATVKCSISGNQWHLISSPVAEAVSGMFSGKYLQEHNESTNLYTDITSTSAALTPMQGFALWGDASGFTATYVGTLNAGRQSFSTTFSDAQFGWNLAGNPYPSPIDWDAGSGWTKSAVNNATYVHVDEATWAAYIGGAGTNGGSRYIAPGQGFFVRASGSGALSMTDDVRVQQPATFYKTSEGALNNLVRLEVSGNNYKDETVLRFLPEATDEFDGSYDAHKLFGAIYEAAQLYSLGGTELAINTLPETSSVPLGMRAGAEGIYTIAATEVNDFSAISLEDTKTGIFTNLLSGSYSFSFSPGESEQRFILHFGTLSVDETENSAAVIYSGKGNVFIELKDNIKADIYIYALSGQLVSKTPSAKGKNIIRLANTGNYIVKVVSNQSAIVKKVFIQQ